jgi:acetate kinase
VGHRIVHGGERFDRATLVTPGVVEELRALASLDPDHLPAEIAIVEAMLARAPVPQVLSFDTTFHRALPRVARLLPIPRAYERLGVRKYGFHGLSFTFLLEELARVAGEQSARGRVVLAHLGAGSSLAAVREGLCVDTTMAFTPTAGVMMATRSGDLDPGLMLWLLRHEHLSVDEVDELVNRRAGLLGVSETTGDMRALLLAEASDVRAAEAIALFCQQVRKAIGALATTVGGIDTLVFSGGIGASAPVIRWRIAQGLEHLGVVIDQERNAAGAPVVSAAASACTVRVMETDEESIIARDAVRVWHEQNQPRPKENP